MLRTWRSVGTADWHHPRRARRHVWRTWKRPTDTRDAGHPDGRRHRHSQRPDNRGNTIWRRRPPAVVTSHAPDHKNATAGPTTRWLPTTRLVRAPKMETYSVLCRPVLAALETRKEPRKEPRRNLNVRDVVLLKEEGAYRNDWPTGRVLAVFESEDGYVRKAEVAIGKAGKRNNFLRPVEELILLVPAETAPESTPAPTEGNQEYLGRGVWRHSPNGCEDCFVINL